MKLPYKFQTCILCLKRKADSWEHIIPKCIGGNFKLKILCTTCNNDLGSKKISALKEAPEVRLAIKNLKNEIPTLFRSIEEGQLYNGTDISGKVIPMRFKRGKLEVKTVKGDNDSVIIDTKRVKKHLKQMLNKKDISESKIENLVGEIEKSEDNKIINLTNNIKMIKRNINSNSIFPSLESPMIDESIITLIAYEYLSLFLGNLILDSSFDFIRNFIIDTQKSNKLEIEHLTSHKYGPFHSIYPVFEKDEIKIEIILFEWLVYIVHIKGFKYIGNDIVYYEDLKEQRNSDFRICERSKGRYMLYL